MEVLLKFIVTHDINYQQNWNYGNSIYLGTSSTPKATSHFYALYQTKRL